MKKTFTIAMLAAALPALAQLPEHYKYGKHDATQPPANAAPARTSTSTAAPAAKDPYRYGADFDKLAWESGQDDGTDSTGPKGDVYAYAAAPCTIPATSLNVSGYAVSATVDTCDLIDGRRTAVSLIITHPTYGSIPVDIDVQALTETEGSVIFAINLPQSGSKLSLVKVQGSITGTPVYQAVSVAAEPSLANKRGQDEVIQVLESIQRPELTITSIVVIAH